MGSNKIPLHPTQQMSKSVFLQLIQDKLNATHKEFTMQHFFNPKDPVSPAIAFGKTQLLNELYDHLMKG